MADADFAKAISTAYATTGQAIHLGRGVLNGELVREADVQIPLKMMTRHGLIAGATGTGKTKTLQGLAEQLSAAGVPVFVADVKGDVSGIADPGSTGPTGAAEGGGRCRRGGLAAVGKFLTSRQGQAIEKQVMRGVFGMLKKR
jgi:hypothetical protein